MCPSCNRCEIMAPNLFTARSYIEQIAEFVYEKAEKNSCNVIMVTTGNIICTHRYSKCSRYTNTAFIINTEKNQF